MYQGICKNCCVEYTTRNKTKFCSVSCSGKYNGKHGKVGGDTSSLKKFIETYGEEEGNKKYREKSEKHSKRLKGKPSPMLGKKHSEESKKKTSENVKQSEYHKSIKGKPYEETRDKGARQKLSDKMKGTFSLGWFIEKYGEEGKKLYRERCENITKTTHFNHYNKKNRNNYSKISQELFWEIYDRLSNSGDKKIYFAELNHEHGCGTNKNFDFVILDNKKIIEYNGNLWHGNPDIYEATDKPNPHLELTSADIWEMDKRKINNAILKGFEVLVIWENEYKNDKELYIKKCLDFLENELS